MTRATVSRDRTSRIEALLSARLVLDPKLAAGRVFFVSDASGRLSLHTVSVDGGEPSAPLLPPEVGLQNPHLMRGILYQVVPDLDRLLVMLDRAGDENYQPALVPMSGGEPELLSFDGYASHRFYCTWCSGTGLAFFTAENVRDPVSETIRVDLRTREVTVIDRSQYGGSCLAANPDGSAVLLSEGLSLGDEIIYLWRAGRRTLLLGTPPEERTSGGSHRLTGVRSAAFVGEAVLLVNGLTEDCFGLGLVSPDRPQHLEPFEIEGTSHRGRGELVSIDHIEADRYRLAYNIDGCSWIYAGRVSVRERRFSVEQVLCGSGVMRDGVAEAIHFDPSIGRHVLSFSTATSPSQIFLVDGAGATQVTHELIRGIPAQDLSPGEDASFISHDGLRVSARLYLPNGAAAPGPRPLVFYIHGGPRKQERPDFTWFSMPLIQLLTLSGFAVFVPNARGSTGYGLSYTKRIDKDWGGLDRLDHVAAIEHLRGDARLDLDRVGVMGRSYGGYMALTLAGRHPALWQAACSMFGPYDLLMFGARMPESWRPVFHRVIGHPDHDRDLLVDRSPITHLSGLGCPLLVVQGGNDPRVLERESSALVEDLRGRGKTVEYLVFEDEGHDILERANKVECYTRVVEFFTHHLRQRS